MNRDFHYPKLVKNMRQDRFSNQDIEEADEKLFKINQEYYKERDIYLQEIEYGIVPEETMQEIRYRHTHYLQNLFESIWGEGAWDERHDLYAYSE